MKKISLVFLSIFASFCIALSLCLTLTNNAVKVSAESRNVLLSKTVYKISTSEPKRMLLVTAIDNYDLAYEVGYTISGYETKTGDTCDTKKYYNKIISGTKTEGETAFDIFGFGYENAKLIIWEIEYQDDLSFSAYAKQGIAVEGGLQIPETEIKVKGLEKNNTKYSITFDFADERENQVFNLYNGQGIEAPENSVEAGYSFAWDKTIASTATENVTYTEIKTPNTNTKYTVKHLLQNVDDDNYTEVTGDEEELFGTTGTDTTATAKEYVGFTAGEITQLAIAGDETTVVEVKYDRNVYEVTWKNGDDTIATYNVRYGATPVFGEDAPTKSSDNTYSYSFTGWDKDIIEVTGNVTYNAQFTANYIDYQVSFIDTYGTVLSNKTDYHYGDVLTVPDTAKASTEDEDYVFDSWDTELPSTVTGNATYTASYKVWQRIGTVEKFNEIFARGISLYGNYRLVSDLDFNNAEISGLGNSGEFYGAFDGQNHILSNMRLKGYGDWEYDSLFGKVKGTSATISNLGIYNITTNNYSDGAISSWLEGSISNVVVYGSLGMSLRPVQSTSASLLVGSITDTGWINGVTVLLKTHTLQDNAYAGIMVGQYVGGGHVYQCTTVCLDETVKQISAVTDINCYDYTNCHNINTKVRGAITYNDYLHEYASYSDFIENNTISNGSLLERVIDKGITLTLDNRASALSTAQTFTVQLPVGNAVLNSVKADDVEFTVKNYDEITGQITLDVATLNNEDCVVTATFGNITCVFTAKIFTQLISTVDQFNTVFSKKAVIANTERIGLANDIDFNGTTITGLGTNGIFYGKFDGNNYMLKNFNVTGYDNSDHGTIFGMVKKDADIRNLVVYNATSYNHGAGILTTYFEGHMENVVVYGTIASTYGPSNQTPSLIAGYLLRNDTNDWVNGCIDNVVAILKTHGIADNSYGGIIAGNAMADAISSYSVTICLDETKTQVSALPTAGSPISEKTGPAATTWGLCKEFASMASYEAWLNGGLGGADKDIVQKALTKTAIETIERINAENNSIA